VLAGDNAVVIELAVCDLQAIAAV